LNLIGIREFDPGLHQSGPAEGILGVARQRPSASGVTETLRHSGKPPLLSTPRGDARIEFSVEVRQIQVRQPAETIDLAAAEFADVAADQIARHRMTTMIFS
jgi:hypothetical protein